jgi:alpha-tubulin suppressor-like RCC1 family protein
VSATASGRLWVVAFAIAGCVPIAPPAANRPGPPAAPVGPLRALDLGWGGSFCALRSDGRVLCWGHNDSGSLGTGTREATSVPTLVPGLADAIQIEGVSGHRNGFCALTASHSVWCWGFLDLPPTRVIDDVADFAFAEMRDISSSFRSDAPGVCARHPNGSGTCVEFLVDPKHDVCDTWLDEARTTCVSSHPTGRAVSAPYPPASAYPGVDTYGVLEFGGPHSRATVQMQGRSCVLRGRQVYCHGTNEYGQLGDPSRPDGAQFLAVPGLDDVVSLDSDQLRSCAVHASGQVVCWGDNQVESPYPHDPELCLYSGKPTRGCNRRPTPLAVSDARQIIITRSPIMILSRTGQVRIECSQEHRETGRCRAGDFELVPDLPPLVRIEHGAEDTCGLTGDGQVVCSGYRSELGDGAPLVDRAPTPVAGVAHAKQVRVSIYGGACAVLDDGGVSCWGKDNPPRGLRDIVQVADNCARAKDGRVWCWGTNLDGEMGQGMQGRPHLFQAGGRRDPDVIATPMVVPHLRNVVDLASRGELTCAVTGSGQVWCWGYLVPARSKLFTYAPTLMAGLPPIAHVFPSVTDMFALATDKTLWHVRKSFKDDTVVPVPEAPLAVALPVDGDNPETQGDVHGNRSSWCVLTESSELRCAGLAPLQVPGRFSQVSTTSWWGAKKQRGCAVRDDGHLLCWGPRYCAETEAPCAPEVWSRISDVLDRVIQVSVGKLQSCAVRDDGTVWCWGNREVFQGNCFHPPRAATVRLGAS